MTQITLTHRIEELNDLEVMIEELKSEAEAIKDTIKQEMTDRNLEEMIVGDYIVRWVDVLSSRSIPRGSRLRWVKAYTRNTQRKFPQRDLRSLTNTREEGAKAPSPTESRYR